MLYFMNWQRSKWSSICSEQDYHLQCIIGNFWEWIGRYYHIPSLKSVIDMLFHNPVVLARTFATLDILSIILTWYWLVKRWVPGETQRLVPQGICSILIAICFWKRYYGKYDYFRTPSITNLLNSLSDLLFLISISLKASLPTKYLNSGRTSLDIMAFKMTLATSIGDEPFSNLGLSAAILFSVICA